MKVAQMEKMAEQRVKEVMELKKASDETASAAWAEAQAARSDIDEVAAQLTSEKKDRAMQQVQ